MQDVDWLEFAGEVLPRRWVQGALRLLVIFMALTGVTAPVVWFVHAEAAAIQEKFTPILQHIIENAVSPTTLPTAGN